jgi:hypothetical protein
MKKMQMGKSASEGRERGRDITLMLVMIGGLTCPFAKHPCGAPNGEGILLSAFLRDGGVELPSQGFA